MHRYRGALVRHCAQVVGESDADEAVQEALLKAHRVLSSGSPVYSLGSWLHAIAHNSAHQLLRNRRLGAEYREDQGGRSEAVGMSGEVQRERLEALVAALLSLPARRFASGSVR